MYNRIADIGFLLFVALIVIACLAQGMLLPRERHSEEYRKIENPTYESGDPGERIYNESLARSVRDYSSRYSH